MQKVAVVTDSSACLPRDLAASLGVQVVPFTMTFGQHVYRDELEDMDDFYQELRTARHLPRTSAPSPAAFLKALQAAGERAPSVLAITLPERLSSAHNSCRHAIRLAREEGLPLAIECMNSGAVAAGQGLIVLEAARAAAAGASCEEVSALATGLASHVHFFAFLDTLAYLAKGGHVPMAAAWIGDRLGLRPVLTAPAGEVRRVGQARSRRGAVDLVLHLVDRKNTTGGPIQALVMHAGVPDEAEALREEIQRRFTCAELYVTPFTPVMGAHSGPGALGVAFRAIGA